MLIPHPRVRYQKIFEHQKTYAQRIKKNFLSIKKPFTKFSRGQDKRQASKKNYVVVKFSGFKILRFRVFRV